MWEIITAASTAGTVVIALLTYLLVRRQSAILKPSINTIDSGDTNKDFRHLSVRIDPPDDAKFKIVKFSIRSPQIARLAEIISDPNTNKPMAGNWKTEVLLNHQTNQTGLFFRGPIGSEIQVEVHLALRSDPSVRSVCIASCRMKS